MDRHPFPWTTLEAIVSAQVGGRFIAQRRETRGSLVRMLPVGRRAVLLGGAAVLLGACSGSRSGGENGAVEQVPYGDDPSQFFELSRPAGASRGVVVVIHGGFWRAQFDLSLGRPLAASLVEEGWTAVNLEYRRVGNGGGWPGTFDDVAAGIDALAEQDVDTSTLVTVGHSAGGHLAVWAAGRQKLTGTPWSDPAVSVTAAVSQAGVLDLETASRQGVGGTAVRDLLGEPTPERFAAANPIVQAPLDIPVLCIHGRDDGNVPLAQSVAYVDKATAAGGDAELLEVDGDHFVLIDRSSDAWRQTLAWLARRP